MSIIALGGVSLGSVYTEKTACAAEVKSTLELSIEEDNTSRGELSFVTDSENMQTDANVVFSPLTVDLGTGKKQVVEEKEGTSAAVKLKDTRTNVKGKGGYSVKVGFGTDDFAEKSFNTINFKINLRPTNVIGHGNNDLTNVDLQGWNLSGSVPDPEKLFAFNHEEGITSREVKLNPSLNIEDASKLASGKYGATLVWTLIPVLE